MTVDGRAVDPCRSAMHASFAPVRPPAGAVAMSSQSEPLGLAILDLAYRAGLGFSCFASIGAAADVSSNDLLEWWEDDPHIGVFCCGCWHRVPAGLAAGAGGERVALHPSAHWPSARCFHHGWAEGRGVRRPASQVSGRGNGER